MTLAVAAVAALAIFLIAIGIATSGGGSAVSARLERYASGRDPNAAAATGQGGLQDILASSVALAQLNRVVEQRDFGANLARDIGRADLKIKVSEFLALWALSIFGVPFLMIVFSLGLPALRNPLFLVIGALVGFLLPRFWLSRRKAGRLNAFNKQLPATITLLATARRPG